MGRRGMGHRFMPGYHVFPGGGLSREDHVPFPYHGGIPKRLGNLTGSHLGGRSWSALVAAALRETFEETGLLLAAPDDAPPKVRGTWSLFANRGLKPDLASLAYVARAITPAGLPIRYNTRFFAADGGRLTGTLAGSGELESLNWHPVTELKGLNMAQVSRFALKCAIEAWRRSRNEAAIAKRPAPLMHHRRGSRLIRAS